jgi:hypothetical protein
MGDLVQFIIPPKLQPGQRPKRAVFGLAAPRTDAERVAELDRKPDDLVAALAEYTFDDSLKHNDFMRKIAEEVGPLEGEPKVPA